MSAAAPGTAVDIDQVHDSTRLYHWSPRANRDSITAGGLRIRQASPQGPQFRLPYVAFGMDPVGAWQMSGHAFGAAARSWDLWQVAFGDLRGLCEVIPFDDLSPREVRCYRSVRASVVEYVATRQVRR